MRRRARGTSLTFSEEAKVDRSSKKLDRTQKTLQQRNKELQLLIESARTLNSSLEMDIVLATVLHSISQMMGAVGSSIWLVDEKKGDLVCLQSAGEQAERVKGWRLPLKSGIVGWVTTKAKGVVIKDTRKDKRHFKKVDKETGIEIRSILAAPMKVRDEVTGVLQVVDTRTNQFTRAHLNLLEGLADNSADAIENARLFEEVQLELKERRKAERRLRKRERQLKVNTMNLEEANTALKVLLRRRDEDKIEFEERILFNLKELVEPYFIKLMRTRLNENQIALLEILESNLMDIVSPFARRMSSKYLSLTPKEIQIANLIKQGRTTKDIADLMNVSNRTVDTHRKNLRIKLGIGKKRANLRTHLLSIQ